MQVRITTNPDPRAMARVLRAIGHDMRDQRPAWRRLLPQVGASLGGNIKDQGSDLGVTWPPLSRVYARSRARRGKGRALLVLSGRLLAETLAGRGRSRLTESGLDYGPSLARGGILNAGSRRIPARPWLGISPELAAEALELLGEQAQLTLSRAAQAMGGKR